MQDVIKLKDILKYTNIQRNQLLKAVAETCRASGESLPIEKKNITKPVRKKRKILARSTSRFSQRLCEGAVAPKVKTAEGMEFLMVTTATARDERGWKGA